jgi:hypothetical protein
LPPTAHVTSSGCAEIGLANLEQLLEEDAQQLKNLTLQFPYYTDAGKLVYLYLPSPQVLRYAQPDSYVQAIHDLIMEKEQASLKCTVVSADPGESIKTREYHPYWSVEGALQKTLTKAKELEDQKLQAECQQILDNLPKLRTYLAYEDNEAAKEKLLVAYHAMQLENKQQAKDYIAKESLRILTRYNKSAGALEKAIGITKPEDRYISFTGFTF